MEHKTPKKLRVFRTFGLLLFLVLSSNAFAQISVNLKNRPLRTALKEIEQASMYKFFFNESLAGLDHPVNCQVSDASLEQTMQRVLADKNLAYRVENDNVVVLITKEVAAGALPQQKNIRITGTVVNEQGEPIIGASVMVKGSTLGTISNMDGEFSFEVPEKATFAVSYIGYTTQTIRVGVTTIYNIVLKDDAMLLDDVVVVGYAPMRKSDFTGSLANVKANELPISNPTLGQALVGRVSGVQVSQTSGAPGEGVKIRVRGVNSLSANSGPLYVIDGYPATEDVNINPSDVESIDILKDAASAAIYGSRGAGGVVLITTKRGAAGKVSVNYDYQFSVQQVSKKLDLLNADQFRDLVIESRNNSYRDKAEALGLSWSPFDDNNIRAAKGLNLAEVAIPSMFFDFTTGKPVASQNDTDWQDAIFRNAPMQRHNVSISGGQENLRYRLSFAHLNQDGIIAPSYQKRMNVRANIDAKVTKKLNVGVNFSFDDVNNREVQADGRYLNDGIVQSALLMFPQFSVYNTDGSYAVGNQIAMKSEGFQMVENPVALAHEINIRSASNRMNFNTNVSYDILDNLQVKANLGAQYYTYRYWYYRPRSVGQDGDMPNSDGAAARVRARDRSTRDLDKLGELTINYNKTFGKSILNVLLGGSAQRKTYDRVYLTGSGFADDRIQEITAIGPDPGSITLDSSTRKSAWTLLSYFGRINYSFNNRYMLTGTLRSDGSSRFGASNRWGFFPSISGGWNVSNEKFFIDKLGTSTSFRLRASWGLSGNNNIGNYEHTSSMSSGGYPFGNSVESAFWAGSFKDAAIGWEKTSQMNLGFDFGILNGRINLIGNYYNSISYDLLFDQTISSISGSQTVKTNMLDAKVRNRGFDFQVDGKILTGQFNWGVSANISVNRNKVLDMGGIDEQYTVSERSVNTHVTRAGLPIGSFYGYIADGIISEKEYANIMIDKSNLVNGSFPEGYVLVGPSVPSYSTVKPGDVKWRDIDGDNIITAKDRDVIGNAYPKFTYGLSTNMSYKGIDLTAVFTGSYGGKAINFQKYYLYNMEGSGNQLASALNRWQSDENPGDGKTFRAARHSTTNVSNRLASYMVDDTSYFRCSNITLGYNLNQNMLKKIGISGLRIYASVDNLFTISKYEGYNPDVDYKDGNNLLPGFDWGVYPLAKTFSVGANLTF